MAQAAFDLTGWATVALASATVILAFLTYWSIYSQARAQKRGFEFERVRQVPMVVPLIVLDVATVKHDNGANRRFLQLSNKGMGTAANIRFSGLYNGSTITAAMNTPPAIGAGGSYTTDIEISDESMNTSFHFDEMLIRYEDVFGNLYSSEYKRFDERRGYYVWRRPWVGKDFGVPRPKYDSADDAEWGFTSREYVNAPTNEI